MFFRNREVRVSLAPKTNETATVNNLIDPEQTAQVLGQVVVASILIVGAVKAINVIGNIIEDKFTS